MEAGRWHEAGLSLLRGLMTLFMFIFMKYVFIYLLGHS